MAGRLDRLLETLDRLLDASRLGAGHLELRPEPLDLVAITRGVVSAADRVLRAAACPLAIEAPDAVLGSWDRLRFEQILGNLVANAVRYGAGQPISIRIAEAADHVQLTVRDHGIGIAADDQQRVFQRFERGCNVGRTAGFGIGLWVAAELCRAMGGRIDVASELGSGAEFTVTLPRQSP
jgi:signal transduction histidine kinase